MKKYMILCLMALLCFQVKAQFQKEIAKDLSQNTKFGGYVIGKYNVTDNGSATSKSGISLDFARLYANGKVMHDWTYMLQMEVCGTPQNATAMSEKAVRIVDAYVEWGHYKVARIKVGEFHRSFSLENPYNPWDYGFDNCSQVISKLVGYADRVGEHSCSGRDFGVQLQGDMARSKKGFDVLHYQIGLFNGQGINHSDANNNKDVIGGLTIQPVKDLFFGTFGWAGKYTAGNVTVNRNRMAFGVKYESDWTARAEYITSEGHKVSDYTSDGTATGSDKADGWYVAVGVPIAKSMKIYGKWDVYRDAKTMRSATTTYNLSANYYLCSNLKLQFNYYFTHKGADMSGDKNFNTAEAEIYLRF